MRAQSITWRSFRRRYEAEAVAELPKLHRRLWQLTADDLERLCSVRYLADAPGSLAAFIAALDAEQVDSTSIGIYCQFIGHALAWAEAQGLIGEPLAVAV